MCSEDFVRCVVGPVGSGKSSACVMELWKRAAQQKPGPDGIRRSRWAVIRNTYGQLRDTTRKTFQAWVPAALGQWNEQQFLFHMRFGDVDSEVLFRALDRPEDKKKLLSLELTGAYINEAREISKDVFEVLQSRLGRYPSKALGGPSWFGLWMDTNPWHTGHWAHKLFSTRPAGYSIFRQPGGRGADAENVENLPPDYYIRLCTGKSQEWISTYVDGLESSSDMGSIFGAQIDTLERRGGLAPFTHETDGIFVNFDLGLGDATALWFWRLGNKGIDVIDHYEASGNPLSHYFNVLEKRADERGYSYIKFWLPHDARARTLVTGSSVLESFNDKFGREKVAIVPHLKLLDGIEAGRALLEAPGTRIHPRCDDGIKALREYRYHWDEDARVFSRNPLHDWASHTGDAWRYVGVVVKLSELLTRQPPPTPQRPPSRAVHEFTLDELWETHRPIRDEW